MSPFGFTLKAERQPSGESTEGHTWQPENDPRNQVADGRNEFKSNRAPRTIGSSASPLMQKIRGGHHGVRMSGREIETIRLWIETGAPYPGTYAALGGGSIGGYYADEPSQTHPDFPEANTAYGVIEWRCGGCHFGDLSLAHTLSDENGLSYGEPDWSDPRQLLSRHLVFNLTRPDKSLVLLAPLAVEAGGFGLCKVRDAAESWKSGGVPMVIFHTTSDPDYLKLLALCKAGQARIETIKRFDMHDFRPPRAYVREMKRYGVIPADLPPDAPLDVYKADRAYWDSFDQSVALKHPAYLDK